MAKRHDGIRNVLTSFINKVYSNVEAEPLLQPLDNERFHLRSAVTSSDARLDIKAGEFWSRGVTAFFDVRVTHVNSRCNQNKLQLLQSLKNKRTKRSASNNNEYWTLRWALLYP